MKRRIVAFASLMLVSAVVAAPAYSFEQPNSYELVGPHTQVTYTVPPLTREPMLTLRERKRVLKFSGDQIRIADTEMGHWISVTTDQIPDLHTVTFSVLLPDINATKGDSYFRTQAIRTTHRTSIGGPDLVNGPLQLYARLTMFGHASVAQIPRDDVLGTISGTVMLVNTCPGPVTPGQDCTAPFVGATLHVINDSKLVTATAKTDAKGFYQVDVPAGNYLVHVAVEGRLPQCTEPGVTVVASKTSEANIECDTGMR